MDLLSDGLLASGSYFSFLLGLNSGAWSWLGLNLPSKICQAFLSLGLDPASNILQRDLNRPS